MKRMQATVEGQKFVVSECKGGYKIVTDDTLGGHYETVERTFKQAGMWVWNMADNHDIANEVCHRMCKAFGKDMM